MEVSKFEKPTPINKRQLKNSLRVWYMEDKKFSVAYMYQPLI